jgi:hypothetical protein
LTPATYPNYLGYKTSRGQYTNQTARGARKGMNS